MNSANFIYSILIIAAAVLSAWALRSLFHSKSSRKNRALSKSELIRRKAIEDFIDRERNPPIPAPLNLPLERFGREQLEQLSVDERVDRFNELASVLESNIPKDVKPFEFHNVTIPWLIQGLKDIGHDIWHWDSPGNLSIWGGDYMRPESAGKLTVEFEHPRTVRLGWQEVWNASEVESALERQTQWLRSPEFWPSDFYDLLRDRNVDPFKSILIGGRTEQESIGYSLIDQNGRVIWFKLMYEGAPYKPTSGARARITDWKARDTQGEDWWWKEESHMTEPKPNNRILVGLKMLDL
jgi:hypothetical protein